MTVGITRSALCFALKERVGINSISNIDKRICEKVIRELKNSKGIILLGLNKE